MQVLQHDEERPRPAQCHERAPERFEKPQPLIVGADRGKCGQVADSLCHFGQHSRQRRKPCGPDVERGHERKLGAQRFD